MSQTPEPSRVDPPQVADEAATLWGFLDFLRATIELKAHGLSDLHLRQPLPPSSMNLGGMLKHLAYVEDYWFGYILTGGEPSEPWASVDWDADPDWEWHTAGQDSGEDLRALFRTTIHRSRSLREVDLNVTSRRLGNTGEPFTLRWILTHLIEEYARHAGHADLIRESIDGTVGE